MTENQHQAQTVPAAEQLPRGLWSSAIAPSPIEASTHHAAEAPLRRIAAKEVAPIILVVGSPADYQQLIETINLSSEQERYSCIPASRTIEFSARHEALFAFRSSHGDFSGITSEDLADCYRSNAQLTKLFHIASESNVAYAAEAIKSALPHFPLAMVRLGEPQKRPDNLPAIASSLICEQLPPTATPADVITSLTRAASRSLDSSASAACTLLTPVEIKNSGDPIPTSVYRCMEDKLLPQANEENLHILLRGGCGIVAFMPHARPISLDIDFTALLKVEQFDRFKELMQAICQGGTFEVRGCPTASDSKRSTYLKGKVVVSEFDNSEVSLDAVAVRRVGGDLFSFEFKYDKVINRHHRIARLDSGATIGVVAPELNLVEKLVAGRGRELEKYDILDATGILANQDLELTLIQRIIERQRHDEKLDAVIDTRSLQASNVDRQLVELGVLSDVKLRLCLLAALNNNTLFSERHNALRAKGVVYHILTPDTLKKVGLINKLLRGLDEVERTRNEVDNRLKPPASAATLWGEGKIMSGVSNLRSFLYSYAQHQLLRKDIYVQRNSRSFERSQSDGFWSSETPEDS